MVRNSRYYLLIPYMAISICMSILICMCIWGITSLLNMHGRVARKLILFILFSMELSKAPETDDKKRANFNKGN